MKDYRKSHGIVVCVLGLIIRESESQGEMLFPPRYNPYTGSLSDRESVCVIVL